MNNNIYNMTMPTVTEEYAEKLAAAKAKLSNDRVSGSAAADITAAIRALASKNRFSLSTSAETLRSIVNNELGTSEARCA